jgi:sphingomyelin phosphodiesterase acid-like 3
MCFVVAIGCFAALSVKAPAQAAAGQKKPGAQTVQVLLVSDIHFEPFWDPGKVAQLAAAPASAWKAILGSPASPDREQKFAALQQTCHVRGADTSHTLFESSLRGMRADAAGAKFVIVSGDLMAHAFSCKFTTLFPKAAPDDYRAFAEKTLNYVMSELREAMPGVPVYAALGNNDSDCGDYQMDANSEFLERTGKTFAADLPAAERKEALRTFAAGGYLSVVLPGPMQRTKMLVLDDVFMSRKYATCSGKPDPAAAATQITWLKQQLNDARSKGEKVWVMAHIPPGVDTYSTAARGEDICEGNAPTMFLSSEALPEAMAGFGDVIQLAIFAHTHMDEVRLLSPSNLDPAKRDAAERGVAVKMVSSISPIDGNNSSFTVAQIDPATATMQDYRVFAASNQTGPDKTGIDTTWTEEYDFAQTYKEPEVSAATLGSLIAGFEADPNAQTSASQSYIHSYGTGMGATELQLFWPQYVCTLKNDEAAAFQSCVCGK